MASSFPPARTSPHFRLIWLGAYGLVGVVSAVVLCASFAGARYYAGALPMLQPLGFLAACMIVFGFAVYAGHRHREYGIALRGSGLQAVIIVSMAWLVSESLDRHGFENPAELVPVLICPGSAVFLMIWLMGGISVLIARRIEFKPPRGLCPMCGYSLVGLEGVLCPECGSDCSEFKIVPGVGEAESAREAS